MKKIKLTRGNGGNYAEVLADFLRQNESFRTGVHEICVCHDEWCDYLNKRGVCNCNSDLIPGSKKENELVGDHRDTYELVLVLPSEGGEKGLAN